MARGWESKAVEEQMSSASRDKESSRSPVLGEGERQRQAKRKSLLLSKMRLARDLEAAQNWRYRAILKRTLAHVEAELEKLDAEDP